MKIKNDGIYEIDFSKIDYNEEKLPESLESDFYGEISKRGRNYYQNNKVIEVYKAGNIYSAKVLGSGTNIYNVEIYLDDQYTADYNCTCPCDYPCKHTYAVLMAISNKEYKEIKLKEGLQEKHWTLSEVVQNIPAEELKEYLMSLDKLAFNVNFFTEKFRVYLPKQTYEFYYNNLYNDLVINNDYESRINDYVERAKQYLKGDEFLEVLKIIKSIIEAYYDSNKINDDDYLFDFLSKAAMLLRIIYRKGDSEIKRLVDKWNKKLEKVNYYDNYYLEDLFLTLK